MKKQFFLGSISIAAIVVFSMVFSSAVFAGTNTTHTLTITNASTDGSTLTYVNNSADAHYQSGTSTCGTCPSSEYSMSCDKTSLAPGQTTTCTWTAPNGCNMSGQQANWKAGKGKWGQLQCFKSPIGLCNNAAPNYTCTISQSYIDKSNPKKGGQSAVQVPLQ